MTVRAALALAGAAALLSGCVAAAIPIAAGGMLARSQVAGREAAPAPAPAVPAGLRTDADDPAAGARPIATGLTALPAPDGTSVATGPAGEAAAASIQGYQGLWNHVRARLAERAAGKPLQGAVLSEGARLDAPQFAPCGGGPLAVLVDLDETAAKANQALGRDGEGRWRRWQGDGSDALAVAPGAPETLAALRRDGVEVIFTSHRSQSSAGEVVAVLDRLGLGPAIPGDTLFLRGGDGDAVPAAQIRHQVAQAHCVVALVGDELSDFSDLFGDNATPVAAAETMIAPLWGAGWFMLPAPLYSTASPSSASAAPQPSGVR